MPSVSNAELGSRYGQPAPILPQGGPKSVEGDNHPSPCLSDRGETDHHVAPLHSEQVETDEHPLPQHSDTVKSGKRSSRPVSVRGESGKRPARRLSAPFERCGDDFLLSSTGSEAPADHSARRRTAATGQPDLIKALCDVSKSQHDSHSPDSAWIASKTQPLMHSRQRVVLARP